jgi:hypothetical protein
MEALNRAGRLVYDGDLTTRPVSNTSTSYPGVAYGHMSDGLNLGYQAALVIMHSPNYGRFWLSVVDHLGNTVSSTQAEALVQAAEARTRMRPMRRTDLLSERICALQAENLLFQAQVAESQKEVEDAAAQHVEIEAQIGRCQETEAQSEVQSQEKNRPERPYSALAKARQKLGLWQGRLERLEKKQVKLEKQLKTDQ